MISPDADEVGAWTAEHGQNGFYDAVELRHGCCGVRKVAPLRRVLAGKRAWLTGLRRAAVGDPARPEVVARWDEGYGLQKFNPMLEWTTEQVWAYIHDHAVPYNELLRPRLHQHRLRALHAGDLRRARTPRAGRWWWEMDAVKECGIHLDPATGRMLRNAPRRPPMPDDEHRP